jgi:histidinol-phosphate aminotransferase
MRAKPQDLLREEILALQAYHVPEASGFVKLDAMENPYPLPPPLRARVAQLAANAPINRYPDAGAVALKARLRQAMNIPAGADLLLGNGSDEIIQMLTMGVARPDAVILGVEPSFVMFRMIAALVGVRFVGVPLRAGDFGLDRDAVLGAIREHRPALVFLAYPNNPTGNLFDRDALTRIIETAPGLVVIDEAYHVFAAESFLPLVTAHDNLLVMRTVSKLGLAGLRLGFAAGSAQWLQQFDKLRLPYNVNVLSQLVAETVLAEYEVLAEQAWAIREERGRLFEGLSALRGVTAFPSRANFILFRVSDATGVFERLKQRRILIKNLHGSHPLLAGCLRVTVGTPQENRTFLSALSDSL